MWFILRRIPLVSNQSYNMAKSHGIPLDKPTGDEIYNMAFGHGIHSDKPTGDVITSFPSSFYTMICVLLSHQTMHKCYNLIDLSFFHQSQM